MRQHLLEDLRSDSAASVVRCDAHFVDPQFGRLVGMDVVNSGGESDKLIAFDCNPHLDHRGFAIVHIEYAAFALPDELERHEAA